MLRTTIALSIILCCGLALADGLTATLKEERAAAPEEPNRQGLELVKRSLTLGPAAVRYQQLVDPKKADAPVVQRYGDYILGLDFPRGTWNWDLEYFINVTVTRPGAEPVNATRAALQQGTYILQQGPRVVADMVWPLPAVAGRPAAELAIRLVAFADEAQWLYLRAGVEGDPEARISDLRLHSYPTTTSGPPERQRWVTSLTRGVQMSDKVEPLDPATEWGLVLHNRMAQEDDGTLLVTDPAEIKSAGAVGVYPIEVQLQPMDRREVHVAMGYFREMPWEKAVAAFRPVAPEQLKRLRAVDWNPPLNRAAWEKQKQSIEELLNLTEVGKTEYQAEWAAVRARAEAALEKLAQEPGDATAARSFVLSMNQATDLQRRLYDPALKALIEKATQ